MGASTALDDRHRADVPLVVDSPNGDVTLKNPPVVQADTIKDKFDAVLLTCKAYDLDDAIESFVPAVGERTAIIPLLNGMRHLDVLDKKFGATFRAFSKP